MAVVSTTPLTVADKQLLDQETSGLRVASLTQQITRTQERLARFQADLVEAQAGCLATKVAILASKDPPVTVPDGATVARVGDNLVVTT